MPQKMDEFGEREHEIGFVFPDSEITLVSVSCCEPLYCGCPIHS